MASRIGLGLVLATAVACGESAGGTADNSSGGAASGGAAGVAGNGGWANSSGSGGLGGASTGGAGTGGTATGGCTGLSAWQQSAPFADDAHVSHPLPSFLVDGRFYVHTKTTAGADDRVLYMASIGPDGGLGPWQVASPDHGGGPHGYTALVAGGNAYHFRNGHIARYTFGADGTMVGDVELLEQSTDTAFGGNKYVWDSAVTATAGGKTWVIHLGGFSFTGYEYRPDIYENAVPLAPTFTSLGVEHPALRPGRAAYFSEPGASVGVLFTGEGDGSRLWRSAVHADGTLGSFEPLADLPAGTGNQRGDLFVAAGSLFCVRGAKVFRATPSATGPLSFQEMPALPEEQVDVTWGDGHLAGASFGVSAGHVYLTGKKRVYYAALLPGQPCGS